MWNIITYVFIEWGDWGDCSEDCGGGTQERTCPAGEGNCGGGPTSQPCNTQDCGKWNITLQHFKEHFWCWNSAVVKFPINLRYHFYEI